MSKEGSRPARPSLKIAYVGGGSRAWARKLMYDLALCPELSGQVALYDIDPAAARLNERLGNWIEEQAALAEGRAGAALRWRYVTVTGLDEALTGADFVVLSIQPGPLEVMGAEIAIAERHGMYFPVGDTTGAPGLVRGLRSAIIYAGFARAIAAICPDAWVINYTNPMSVCTRTLTRVAPGLKAFGCCHEVFSVQRMLAGLVARSEGIDPVPPRSEIRVNVSGINHFTWIDRAAYGEIDLLALVRRQIEAPVVLRFYDRAEVEGWHDWFHSADRVKFELFRRYGILAAAGDRHLVEFLPGFIRSPEELFRWGVIRTPMSYRLARWSDAPQQTLDLLEGRTSPELKGSGEEGVAMLKALLGLGDLVTNVNLENRGQVANLPLRAVVETNARFTRDQVQPLAAGALPAAVQALVARHVANQELIVEAALSGDRDLAFQAILNDPTNPLPPDESWAMFGELLAASAAYLPGWNCAIA